MLNKVAANINSFTIMSTVVCYCACAQWFVTDLVSYAHFLVKAILERNYFKCKFMLIFALLQARLNVFMYIVHV